MKLKKSKCQIKLFAAILIFALGGASNHLNASRQISVYFLGPSISKHFIPSSPYLNELHPGLGGEFQVSFSRWVFGLHGYLMVRDSHYQIAYWMGITGGYRIGKKKGFWLEPALIMGGIKKFDYLSGNFSFFALPMCAIGYGIFGLNVGYIPKIPNVINPILSLQIKIRVL